MRVAVIVPPAPIVTPANIAGGHAADDAGVIAMIQAVTEAIDGPGGWLGRALGEQTLELSLDCWPACRELRLPYPPIVEIVSVTYLDANGAEQVVDPALYQLRGAVIWFRTGFARPALGDGPEPVRIRYTAGYNGTAVAEGGTGPVPERARQAIIVCVQHLRSTGAENLFLRREEVEGVGKVEYTVSEQATVLVHRTADNLLSTLRIWSL